MRHRRRSKPVIHISIRSRSRQSIDHTNSLQSKTSHQRHQTKKRRKKTNSVQPAENTFSSTSTTKLYPHHQSWSTVVPYKDTINDTHHRVQTKDAWLDQTGNTRDFHWDVKKNKNKICSTRCMIISIIITILIIAIIVTTILLAILLQPKTVATSTTTIVLRWNQTGVTVAGVGVTGNSSDHLNGPTDAILDHAKSLYVVDRNNHRIQKFLSGTSQGITVAGNTSGIAGTGLNDLRLPAQVFLSSNGDMFVVDTYNQRILKWPSGSSSAVLVAGVTGMFGNTSDRLNYPYGIDYDSVFNTLYVADYLNSRVMAYSSNASSGSVVAGGNGNGFNTNQLYFPVGLYYQSSSNDFVIVNHATNNILRWSLSTHNWTLIAGDINGNTGDNSTMLARPTYVKFDPMGNMYVADRNNHRIQLFMNGHTEAITIAGITGVNGSNSTLLSQPWSVELDNQLNLYVSDSNNHRIQKFMRY